MRVTVCFGQTRVIVPCKGGATVADLVKEACVRYKKAIGKGPSYFVRIKQLVNGVDDGILDVDDYVYDVVEDRDKLIAIFEEEDQSYRYNGWDHTSIGSGSDGHRSPQPTFQHQMPEKRYGDDKSTGSRSRSKAPTGNATVIKHEKRNSDLEVNVGADALKSSSNSNIIVRDSMVIKNGDRAKSPVKKSSGYSQYYYGRRESGSGQEEDSQLSQKSGKMLTTVNSPGKDTTSSLTANSDTNLSVDSGHHSIKNKLSYTEKNYGNFVRGLSRQSIMGMLSESYDEYNNFRPPPDGGKQNSFDLDDPNVSYSSGYRTEHYLPPPPDDPSMYPRFYNDCQEMFVDIDKRPLGIKVTSYREKKVFLGLLVESVDKDGRSEREGLLQQGDVIIEINNYILAQYTLTIAQEIFKDAMKFPELQLRVYPIEERERASAIERSTVESNNTFNKHRHTPSIPVLSIVEPTPPKASKISSAKSLPDLNASFTTKSSQDVSLVGKLPLVARMSLDTLSNNTRKIGNMFEIELRKGDQGLGFSITTRDTPVGDPGPIYIKNILPKGAAIQDGRLHAGDRLLKVNDIEMTGQTQESAVNILRCIDVGSIVTLVVSRHINTLPRKMKDDPATDKVLTDDSNREYFKFEIALNDTGSAGLGISLKGNQSKKTKKDLGIFVKSVFHGGAAYQDGRLQPNDQLVSVNGQPLIGMTNHEAIDTLRISMSTVGNVRGMIQMEIARRKPRAGRDPTSPRFSSEASSEISDSLVNDRSSRTSFEITETSRNENYNEDSFRYGDDILQQIDQSPLDESYNDASNFNGGDWSSPEPQDEESDPFSRESVFRQSISEKRKGAASRDAQSTDTFKAIKNKQISSEIVHKKEPSIETKPPTPLKWVKPTGTKSSHSANSTPSNQTPRKSPSSVKRNLNSSSNLPARNNRQTYDPDVEVGPTLGIAKSSSLESLQTAVENFVDNEESGYLKAQPRVLRGRVLNESFRAALDQSYDMDNLSGRPMATLREEGSGAGVSPLVKSNDGNTTTGPRTHEKKRAGKSYKIFGIFRVGKNKRSLSSDRNLDSNSSTSSSPRLTESETHKKLLEAKREDDYRKHQEETERIQAKAKAMREQQKQRRKEEENRYRSMEDLLDSSDDRTRAPSVPVTAMQRINLDPKESFSEVSSGRRSVEPVSNRQLQPQTFEWHTSKRPTSPVNYGERGRHKRPEKKPSGSKPKLNPDYSSLPRKPRLEPNAGRISDNTNRAVTPRSSQAGPPTSPSYQVPPPQPSLTRYRNSGQNGNGISNQDFYNMQKPPGSKKRPTESKTVDNSTTRGQVSESQRQGRPDKPKAGRTLYYDDVDSSPSPSTFRSKTPQPYPRSNKDVSPRPRPVSTTPYNGLGFSPDQANFHREDSPEPPPAVLRNHRQHNTGSSGTYRHSVHVDAPSSRRENHQAPSTRSRSQQLKHPPTNFKWKTQRPQRHDHDYNEPMRTDSPSSTSSAAERNRDAVKKIFHQTRYRDHRGTENIVISPPYNL